MIRQNRKLQLFILLTLVCLVGTMSIAYAVLSTTLNINGTAQVQDASWNVHFDNVQVNPYSVEINPVITDNNKITFSADLTTPGDFYKFTVDIVNEGSIDAMIESIAKVPELTTEQKKYLRYEVEYVDGTSINDSQLLKSGETKTISVLFSYRNDIPTSYLPTTETDFDLEIVLVYVQANTTGTEISGNEKLVKIVSGDLNTVGSEICIDTECFYLISNDGYNVKMLAKYNLYAGAYWENGTSTPYGNEATGRQDSTMLGWKSGQNWRNGVIPFSESQYWNEPTGIYPLYVYNSNSNIYPYIENYKQILNSWGVTVKDARPITYEELISLGCVKETETCKDSGYAWLYTTTYWTATADNYINIYIVNSSGNFRPSGYNGHDGTRPLIIIPITEF